MNSTMVSNVRFSFYPRPYYPTYVYSVSSDGSVLTDLRQSSNSPNFKSMRLQSLLDAGIDPNSISCSSSFGTNISNVDSLNSISDEN